MKSKFIPLFACLIFASTASLADGQKTYNSLCVACHGNGNLGAPTIGNKDKWVSRIAEGQSRLIGRAYAGMGAMPPKGGNPNLSLTEFAGAATYMANEAGANWATPNAEMLEKINEIYQRRVQTLALSEGNMGNRR